MTLPNNTAAVTSAFKALATAQISHEKVADRIITTLRDEGVNNAADISKGGRYIGAFMEGVALAVLTDAQFKVWSDTALATKVKGELTKRGELMTKVSSRASKVRAEFVKAMAAPAAKRGAGSKSTPTEVFFKTVDSYVQRFGKEDASDRFDFDPLEARAALVAMLKTLR